MPRFPKKTQNNKETERKEREEEGGEMKGLNKEQRRKEGGKNTRTRKIKTARQTEIKN